MAVEHEPTRSQQTNRLIEMCRQVEAGADAATLGTYLEARRAGLQQAREDFISRYRKEGEEYIQAFRAEIDAVLQGFDGYRQALDEIAAWFGDRDMTHLRNGVAALIDVTPRMLEALDNYEARYMMAGPTRHMMVNALMKAIPAAQSGQLPREELERMLTGATQTFQKAIAEIDAYPHKDEAGLAQRRAGFEQVINGLRRMQRWLEDGDARHLEEGLQVIEEAHGTIEESFNAYREAKFTGQPTASPMANWVINAAEGVKNGQYPPQILAQAIDWLEAEVARIRETFEKTAETPTSSAMIQDELPRTMEAFDLHEEALKKLRVCVAAPTSEGLDEGIGLLKDAVTRLHASQQLYEHVGEREGKVLCPQCQRANPPENRHCDQCGTTLPRVMDLEYSAGAHSTFEVREAHAGLGQDDDQMVMTTHLKRIFDACEAVHAGQIGPSEFLEVLDWGEGLLHEAEQKLAELPPLDIHPDEIPEEDLASFQEQKALADETRDLLRRGIDEFRQGLDQMREYARHPDQGVLVGGIRTVWEASRKIYQCQKMGEAVERLESPAAASGPDGRSRPAPPPVRPGPRTPAATPEASEAPWQAPTTDQVHIEDEDD